MIEKFKIDICENGIIVDYYQRISWHTKIYKFEEIEELFNELNQNLNKNYEVGDTVVIKKEKV